MYEFAEVDVAATIRFYYKSIKKNYERYAPDLTGFSGVNSYFVLSILHLLSKARLFSSISVSFLLNPPVFSIIRIVLIVRSKRHFPLKSGVCIEIHT